MTVTTDTNPNAFDALTSYFTAYGLESLLPEIQKYMRQGITDQATLLLTLRQSQAYKDRFPAMAALNAKGRGFSEADYINYERNAASTESQYGLPRGFLTDPHRIQGMLEADVSASEVVERAKVNQAAALDAPQETKDALKNLYGLGQDALTAYYFDPNNALPYLQNQYASATIAGEAARQRLDISRTTAEALNAQGVSAAQADAGFQQVAGLTGLESGSGETVDQQTLIAAALSGDPTAKAAVQRVGQGRVGQFQGGGSVAGTQSGVAGLGSSGTR